MKNARLKVGILGGSFDPAHPGHALISVEAIKVFGFDYVIWLVANQNPLKPPYKSSPEQRLKQALMMARHPRILVSSAELDLKTFYIYDTLKKLKERLPDIDFTWLMGIDNLESFHKWHNSSRIPDLCKIVIFDRLCRTRLVNRSCFWSKFKPFVAKTQTNNIIIHRGRMFPFSSSEIKAFQGV
jgi:nicotinate-nucleotide adenylyltransferase